MEAAIKDPGNCCCRAVLLLLLLLRLRRLPDFGELPVYAYEKWGWFVTAVGFWLLGSFRCFMLVAVVVEGRVLLLLLQQ